MAFRRRARTEELKKLLGVLLMLPLAISAIIAIALAGPEVWATIGAVILFALGAAIYQGW